MFDLLLTIILLPVLVPLILLIALLSFVLQGPPVLFRQQRVGKDFKRFDIYKFRTMTAAAPGTDVAFDAGNTSRVTPLGKILRKTKFDELPQILNVIRGEMSFVGPRPEVPKWVDMFRDDWEAILTIKPGITDPASIKFRNEEEILAAEEDPNAYYREVLLPHKIALYKGYVANKSLGYDLSILLKTLKRVVFS